MKHLIKGKNTATALRIALDHNEYVIASPARLIAAEGDIRIVPLQKPGLLRNWAEKLQGKALALDTIQAVHDDTWILLATPMHSSLATIDFFAGTTHKTEIFIRQNALLAAHANIKPESAGTRDIRTLVDLLHSEIISLRGSGQVFITGHGAVEHVLLQEHQDIVVDAANLLAWDQDITCAPVKGGLFAMPQTTPSWGENKTLLRLSGAGSVWLQTHCP